MPEKRERGLAESQGPETVALTGFAKEDTDTSSTKRQTWASQVDFIMATLGAAVGLGNIWRFPYLCYKNGGGAFLVPYFVSFLCAGVPMFLLEASLGQYTSLGCTGAWRVVPAFKGIGFASQTMMFYANIYYMVVVAWAVYYTAVSFTSVLPWATCDNVWNTDRCFVSGMNVSVGAGNLSSCNTSATNCTAGCQTVATNCSANSTVTASGLHTVDPVVEFWENRALQISGGIDEPGQVVWGLAVALLVTWVLIYICVCRGVRWTGKIVYFTALFPYVILTVIIIRGVTLDGAADGLTYYLKPNFSKLAEGQVWIDGCTQVLYSYGVAMGFMITLGSYNKFHHKCVRNCLIVACANTGTSLYAGLAVFSVLGFMAKEQNVSVADVAESGPGLVFIAYPKAVTQMPLSPLWSALFFLMILFVGLDSAFLGVEGFLTPIIDAFPKILYKMRNRMVFVAMYCVFCYLVGLSMVTEGGMYVFQVFDFYSCSGLVLLLVCFSEAIVIGWIFGADRYYDALELMLGYRVNFWLKLSWKYLTPCISMAILIFQAVTFTPLTYNKTYVYPVGAQLFGACLVLSAFISIPAVFLWHFCSAEGSFSKRLKEITTPILRAHQVAPRWMELKYRWTPSRD